MNNKLRATVASLAMFLPPGMALPSFGGSQPKPKPTKICLQCRKPHKTGKPFCSATCKVEYDQAD